jgi:hypothetical protein
VTKGPLGVSVDETPLTGGSLPQNQWSSSRTKPLHAPTILIVGGADFGVVELNEQALARLRGPKARRSFLEQAIVSPEPGALEAAIDHAARWFERHLTPPADRTREACVSSPSSFAQTLRGPV